jgi:hypothetical protein
MQLSYLFLADSAITHEGKFFVFGGGLHHLQSLGYPSIIPTLALVAGILPEPEELGVPHKLSVKCIASDDSPIFSDTDTEFTVNPNPQHPEVRPIYILAFNLRGAPLPGPGRYRFLLFVDGKELGTVSFYAGIGPPDGKDSSS